MTVSNEQPERERRLALPRHPRAAGEAREFVDGLLDKQRVSARSRESAVLVSSELVSNAYLHGEGQIELRVNLLEDRLRIEVIDEGRGQTPAVHEQGEDDTGGWGLQIVDRLALRWGVFEGTTHVWADVAVA